MTHSSAPQHTPAQMQARPRHTHLGVLCVCAVRVCTICIPLCASCWSSVFLLLDYNCNYPNYFKLCFALSVPYGIPDSHKPNTTTGTRMTAVLWKSSTATGGVKHECACVCSVCALSRPDAYSLPLLFLAPSLLDARRPKTTHFTFSLCLSPLPERLI